MNVTHNPSLSAGTDPRRVALFPSKRQRIRGGASALKSCGTENHAALETPDAPGNWQFTPDAYERLERDKTVARVYDNGDYDPYLLAGVEDDTV